MKAGAVIQSIAGIAALALLPGCASIVSGRRAEVAIDSYPSNANVDIRDNNGRRVASLTTPGVASLKRNRRFFLPARYTAVIEAPGYQPAEVPIRSTVNPWILGNVVIGGIPGLVVDNATGAAWKPRHSEIHQELSPFDGATQTAHDSADGAPQHGSEEAAHYIADQSDQQSAFDGGPQNGGQQSGGQQEAGRSSARH